MSDIRYRYYPQIRARPDFVNEVVAAFRTSEDAISTVEDDNGLKSDDVLDVVRDDLEGVRVSKNPRGVEALRPARYTGS